MGIKQEMGRNFVFDRLVHVIADYVTRPTKERKRGQLAEDHIAVASALREFCEFCERSARFAAVQASEAPAEPEGDLVGVPNVGQFRPPEKWAPVSYHEVAGRLTQLRLEVFGDMVIGDAEDPPLARRVLDLKDDVAELCGCLESSIEECAALRRRVEKLEARGLVVKHSGDLRDEATMREDAVRAAEARKRIVELQSGDDRAEPRS